MLVFIVGLLANITVKRGVDASRFGIIDRLLGGAFGAARGILLVAVVLMFMTMSTVKNNEMAMMAGSKLTPSFMPMVTWLDGFLPQELQRLTKWMKIDDEPLQSSSTSEQSQQQEP
jgi:membrane protein required for colicin V production